MASPVGSPAQTALDLWVATATTSGANALTCSKAAGSAGVKHVAKRVIITLANNGAAAQPLIQVALNDGATAKLQWSLVVAAVSTSGSGLAVIDHDNLDIVGSESTAMSLTSPALAANSNISLNLIGYDFGRTPQPVPVNTVTAAP